MDRSDLIVGTGMGFMWLMLCAAPLCQPQGCILFYALAGFFITLIAGLLILKKDRKERLMVNALRMESPTLPMQPPQPIILTAQQNRQPNANANNNVYDLADIARLYANNYGSNGQPPPKPEVKEPPKVEPIPPRKILSAISTLELGD